MTPTPVWPVAPLNLRAPGKSLELSAIRLGSGVPGGGVAGTAPAPETTTSATSAHTTQLPALNTAPTPLVEACARIVAAYSRSASPGRAIGVTCSSGRVP